MHFPLSDWIDSHAECRHNLGLSGMGGVVSMPRPSPSRVAANSSDEWSDALRGALAEYLRVDAKRVFLSHGAAESNSWVLYFLAQRGRSGGRTCRIRWPEYPPLVEMARHAGYRLTDAVGPVPLAVLSLPRNPEGVGWTSAELDSWAEGARSLLVDETFREFSGRPSRAEAGTPGVWTTGSFSKFWGADSARVGYAVAPPEAADGFARFHAVAADDIPPYSAALALQLLARRGAVSRLVRSTFERNRAALRQALPSVPSLDGPVYFDRGPGRDGDTLAARCLEASVLVCPGSFFGAPEGVRICLTRPSFRRDLAAYLTVRGGAYRRRARPTTSASATRTVPPLRGGNARALAAPW
ncbi:MAG TPA: aminotransferase class I/II-fold pyridoxal phosphate-dependent enzyme [Thermoplasmata archaeon]|nr:aminotransferase class I/II-fold pyridoxal phosphate-dependent enzyme [Thermoplasmata archaeon]